MTDDELLDEMLVELERRRRQGEPATLEDVSREHPHLLDALRKRIEERLLGQLVERYERGMDRGETPDLDTLCRDHPHLKDPLRRRIDQRILKRLASRYEQLVSQGKTPGIGELCREHPHLEASLREMIAALDEMKWLENLASWDGDLLSGGEGAGPSADTVRDAAGEPLEPISLEAFQSRLESSGLLRDRARKERIDQLLTQSSTWTALGLARQLLAEQLLTDYQCEMLFSRKAPTLTFGTYELTDEIGKGGMGRVYRCRHGLLGRTYALKVLKAESLDSDTRRRRFLREIRATGKLDHPNVVGALFADEQEGKLYLVMPLVPDDLEKLLRRKGRLSLLETLHYIRQAAEGLEYAHRQHVLHRDIKPGNMLVDPDGRLRIADFGLARLLERESESSVTMEGRGGGTGPYMAPEQALDMASADERSDIYSLGCTMYRLLTGEFLCTPAGSSDSVVAWYEAHLKSPIPDLRRQVPDAPAALQTIFRRMVAKRPHDRYPSAAELASDLERVERDVVRRAALAARLPRFPAPGRRTVISAVLFAVSLALLFVAFRPPAALPMARGKVLDWSGRRFRTSDLQTALGNAPPDLEVLDLSGARWTGDVLPPLADFSPDLRELYLGGTAVNDQELSAAAGLSSLRVLALDQTAIGAAGIRRLSSLARLHCLIIPAEALPESDPGDEVKRNRLPRSLAEVGLVGGRLTGDRLGELAQLPELRRLEWDRLDVAMAPGEIASRLAALPRLEILRLRDCSGIDSQSLGELRRKCPQLVIVEVESAPDSSAR